MRRKSLWDRMRSMLARLLARLPWACEALLAVWEVHGGWRMVRDALSPRWHRVCMADADRTGACFCGRYVTVERYRHVYQATQVDRDSLAGVLEEWERKEGLA